MNRCLKSVRGVTLLEIMLVLAIAAMIVVMSIRYYQSASSNQQANTAMSQVQAVMAAMDNLGMSAGYTNANTADLTALVGTANMTTPTGGTITLGTTSATSYSVTFPLNATICPNVRAKIQGNPKATATCTGGTLTLNYDSTK